MHAYANTANDITHKSDNISQMRFVQVTAVLDISANGNTDATITTDATRRRVAAHTSANIPNCKTANEHSVWKRDMNMNNLPCDFAPTKWILCLPDNASSHYLSIKCSTKSLFRPKWVINFHLNAQSFSTCMEFWYSTSINAQVSCIYNQSR